MSNYGTFWRLSGAACVLAGTAFAQVISSPAATPTPVNFTQSYVFLPVGLAATETAQINVVNTTVISATTSGTLNPVAAPICNGTISFLSSGGGTIGKAATFSILPGQIFSASLPYASLGVSGGARTVIRGQISVSSAPFATPNVIVSNSCSLAYSFETFDTATGVTHVFTNVTGSSVFAVPLLSVGLSPSVP